LEDYKSIGYAKGALEYNIELAIRKALQDLGQPAASDGEIDRWRLVLCKLAGQQQVGEPGTVTKRKKSSLPQAC
jgi:hypothetical protein